MALFDFVQKLDLPQQSGTSVNGTFASNLTAGNTVVVGVGIYSGAAAGTTVTDTLGNSYVLAIAPTDTLAIFVANNVLGGASTITLANAGATGLSGTCSEYVGATAVDQVSAQQYVTSGDTAYDSGTTPTTTAASELIVGIVAHQNNNADTPPAGFTQRSGFNDGPFLYWLLADKTVSSTGTFNFAKALSIAGYWWAGIVTLKAAATAVVRTRLSLLGVS